MAKKAADKKKQVFEARPPVSLSLFGPFLSVKMSAEPRLHYNNSPSRQPTAPQSVHITPSRCQWDWAGVLGGRAPV